MFHFLVFKLMRFFLQNNNATHTHTHCTVYNVQYTMYTMITNPFTTTQPLRRIDPARVLRPIRPLHAEREGHQRRGTGSLVHFRYNQLVCITISV